MKRSERIRMLNEKAKKRTQRREQRQNPAGEVVLEGRE